MVDTAIDSRYCGEKAVGTKDYANAISSEFAAAAIVVITMADALTASLGSRLLIGSLPFLLTIADAMVDSRCIASLQFVVPLRIFWMVSESVSTGKRKT